MALATAVPLITSVLSLVMRSPTVPVSSENETMTGACTTGVGSVPSATTPSLNCRNSMLVRVSVPSGLPERRSVMVQLPSTLWTCE